MWQEVQAVQAQQLFTTSSVMRGLQELWHNKLGSALSTHSISPTGCRFSVVHLVRTDALQDVELPLYPGDFEKLISSQCKQAREMLRDK